MTDQLHIYAFGKKRKQEICEKRKIQAKAIRQMNRLIERLKKENLSLGASFCGEIIEHMEELKKIKRSELEIYKKSVRFIS